MASRSSFLSIALLGKTYTAMVRGVPDIVFFLFFVIALDQALEWLRHQALCPDWSEPDPPGRELPRLPAGEAAPVERAAVGP
jgi:polar amino acid transport system permease protein